MGYLKEKHEARAKEAAEISDLPKVKPAEIEGLLFLFSRVRVVDFEGKYGHRHAAVCDIKLIATGDEVTVFIDGSAVVQDLEIGIRDNHDWNDGCPYVLAKKDKKDGTGKFWCLEEGE